jgi:hypothetical protein
MDESSGKLLPALPLTPPAEEQAEVDSVYLLQSLSRTDQRARVCDPDRSMHLLPSEPRDTLTKKLQEEVNERRQLQRQEEAGKGRPRRAMNALRALMLKGNKQAKVEYFQRREEEELAKKQAIKKSNG